MTKTSVSPCSIRLMNDEVCSLIDVGVRVKVVAFLERNRKHLNACIQRSLRGAEHERDSTGRSG